VYERQIVHAIQHTKEKGFQLRYRFYGSKKERDEIFETIKTSNGRINDPIEKVTLTITAETVAEQQTMDM
jgi:hypothetical protein